MGLIREPLDVNFYVDARPLTKEEEKAISDYIKADKLKRAKKQKQVLRYYYHNLQLNGMRINSDVHGIATQEITQSNLH